MFRAFSASRKLPKNPLKINILPVLACFIIRFCLHVLFPHFGQKSPSSSMGEDSFGLVANDAAAADDEGDKIAAEAVNPGVILKSKSASEVISRSNESLDEHFGGGGGLRSTNRTSFKAARQHVKVDAWPGLHVVFTIIRNYWLCQVLAKRGIGRGG